MGFMGGLLGTAGGTSGTGYSGPSGGAMPDYLVPVLNSESQEAQMATMAQLGQQGALLQALQGQGGLQAQTNAYNQFNNLAQGIGPNPAQAQFQQNANQLAKQQSGMIGAQKGINPGLAARLIANQGASAGQNIAGQAATLQAEQQLQGMGGAANMANTMAGQQLAQANAYTGQRQNQQQMLLGALTGNIGQGVNQQSNINNVNAGLASNVMGQQGKMFGGLMQGAGQAAMMLSGGGMVPGYAGGGSVMGAPQDPNQPQSDFAKSMSQTASAIGGNFFDDPTKQFQQNNQLQNGASSFMQGLGHLIGGSPQQPQIMAGGAGDMAPMAAPMPVMNAACGGAIQGETYANKMQAVPGKASVKGDSLKNDTVPAKLSPGEVIIPRSVMQSSDPAGNAAKFVAAVMAKKGRGMG